MFLRTVDEIVGQLGGSSKFARWYGVNIRSVTAWKRRGFPPKYFHHMTTRLHAEFNITGPVELWGQVEP